MIVMLKTQLFHVRQNMRKLSLKTSARKPIFFDFLFKRSRKGVFLWETQVWQFRFCIRYHPKDEGLSIEEKTTKYQKHHKQ